MTRSTRSLLLLAALTLVLPWARALAQDPPPETVRLSLRYNPGTKPGVLVLRVAGVTGDSVRAIIQRDFDYGDRINVIASAETGLPDTPTGGRNGNYALFARLGAIALVQASPTATGLHVAVHNVADGKVERVKDFSLEGAPNSREWRMSMHAVSDELEAWITGVRGIAATRIAFVQGARNGRLHVIDSDGAFPTPVGTDAGVFGGRSGGVEGHRTRHVQPADDAWSGRATVVVEHPQLDPGGRRADRAGRSRQLVG